MEKSGQRQKERKAGSLEQGTGIPLETSPYTQYSDLEDYKRQGYGQEGHLEPKPGRGAGSTEAPTLSGGAVSSEAQAKAIDAINRKGVP